MQLFFGTKGLLLSEQLAKQDPSDLPSYSSRTPLSAEISISDKGNEDPFTKRDSNLNDGEIEFIIIKRSTNRNKRMDKSQVNKSSEELQWENQKLKKKSKRALQQRADPTMRPKQLQDSINKLTLRDK